MVISDGNCIKPSAVPQLLLILHIVVPNGDNLPVSGILPLRQSHHLFLQVQQVCLAESSQASVFLWASGGFLLVLLIGGLDAWRRFCFCEVEGLEPEVQEESFRSHSSAPDDAERSGGASRCGGRSRLA